MREVKIHLVAGARDFVRIFPEGDVGKGGAMTNYRLALGIPGQETGKEIMLKFQTESEHPDGVTEMSLLAVVIDRLQFQQKTPQSSREISIAITHLETAMLWLQQKAREGVSK